MNLPNSYISNLVMKINYNNRKIAGVKNTPNGQVSGETIFHYKQDQQTLTATYKGGLILEGYLLGSVQKDSSLQFVYHHMDIEGNLFSGYCESIPELLSGDRIRLHEKWLWTHGGDGNGESVVEEII